MSISTSTDTLFNNAIFAALPNDSFRVKVSARNNGTLIWVECKQSKNQWQTTITNIGECGPSGFPEAAVFACLQVALNVACSGGNFNEGPEVNASLPETNMKLTLKLTSIGTVWRPEFTFTLLPVGLEKVDRLEAVLRDVQEENRILRRTLEHNVDLIGEIKAYHGDLGTLAVKGWAICNGTTPAEQGIQGALRDEATPDLTGGVFIKGGPVENLGRRMEATTLVISSEHADPYTHGEVTVPTDGTIARNADGVLPFSGKWEAPGCGLKLQYNQPEVQPRSYSVVYVMKVK